LEGSKGLKAGGQDDGAHVQFDHFVLHGVVDGVDAAKLHAHLAAAGFEVHAHVAVDGRYVGHGLGIGHIDRLAALEPHVVFRGNELHVLLLGDLVAILSRVIWPVGHTAAQAPQAMQTSVLMEGGVDFHLQPRPVSAMALLPIFSHMRTHRPQRMQVSSSVLKRGFVNAVCGRPAS
jgi:hypothetical protein